MKTGTKTKTERAKTLLVVTVEIPLFEDDLNMVCGDDLKTLGDTLSQIEEVLQGEVMKVKSGPFDNTLSGWITKVEVKTEGAADYTQEGPATREGG